MRRMYNSSIAALKVAALALALAACQDHPTAPPIIERTWGYERNAIPHGLAGPFLIQNVSVVDVASGTVQDGRDVVVEGGRVKAVTEGGTATAATSTKTINGTGKYVIPGLWDMHVHLSAWGDAGRDIGFRLLLANGITGVRDMGGFPGFLPRWRDEIENGAVAPTVLYTAQAFSFPGVPFPAHYGTDSPGEARAAVRRFKSLGASFIKVHQGVPAHVYTALTSEAQALGLPVVGHTPRALTGEQVSNAGQRSIEHMFGIVGRFDDFFRPRSIKPLAEAKTPELLRLFETFKANGTWVTPTTAVFLKVINAQDDSFDRWARRKYAPYSLHGRWDQERKQFRSNVSTEDRKRYAKFELEIIGEMHRAGVRLLAGSDTGAFDTSPGFELHDELQMLVEAGLTPAEVLRCATSGAAEFLNLLDSRGTVEPGKAADLLLLDENPLVDSDNLQRINTVFLNGELYRRDDLDTMLATAERLAKQL